MEIILKRYQQTAECTFGILTAGTAHCLTLEDVGRAVKLKHETRIPAGTYKLQFRKVGLFIEKYKKRFPKMHKGMIQLCDVPQYEYILIHIGNQKGDTSGCILLGEIADEENNMILHSEKAYKRMYPVIAAAMEKEECTITIIDEG